MTAGWTITYGDCPPSVNTMAVGRSASFHKYARVKRKWEGIWGMLWIAERLPKNLTAVRAHGTLRFPHQRRRDEGNYRAFIEKTLGDALVAGGWIPDDTPEHFVFDRLEIEDEKGAKRTTLTLEFNFREEG